MGVGGRHERVARTVMTAPSPHPPIPSNEQPRQRLLKRVAGGLVVVIRRRRTADANPGPQLTPLTPRYQPAQHAVYVEALEQALTGPNQRDIHNVALTGAYGAGKSSILREVTRRHRRQILQISLSTLGARDKPQPNDKPTAAETPTNRIQKEIVKQLLYQVRPGQLPGSHYRRLGRLRRIRTIVLALVIGAVLALLGFLPGLTERLARLAVPVDPNIPLAIGVSWAIATLVTFVVLALFHNRIAIEKFSAASATISLSPKSETYFDEYLDEIVYFFEVTKKPIVIFEDIDRFDEPYIFETLRSLNTLLNSAKQLRGRNIRFIYAIKDSIFDALSRREAQEQVESGEAASIDAAAAEIARANRTKFFDLVIPVVPFVTHLNARDLMYKQMEDVQPAVDAAVIDLVARHLPDMRLIIEARNEYLIFSHFVPGTSGLTLKPTSLFAMMLYKSTHLTDFENIRTGTSHLDALYDARGTLIQQNLAALDERADNLRRQTREQSRLHARAELLGRKLLELVLRDANVSGRGGGTRHSTFTLGGTNYDEAAVRSPAFWQTYAQSPDTIRVTVNSGIYGPWSTAMSIDDVALFVAPSMPDPGWMQKQQAQIDAEHAQIRRDRAFLAHATMEQLLATPRFSVTIDSKTSTFAELAETLIPSALARQLIAKGYIDADYALYTSNYYGLRVTSQASNFILNNIDRNRIDQAFPLTAGEVDSILSERGDVVLSERALLNVSIFDRLLGTSDPRFETVVTRFATADDDEEAFLRTYFVDGSEKLDLAQRVARVWPSILTFVIRSVDTVEGATLRLLDSAFRGLDEDVEYDVDEDVRTAIEGHYGDLSTFTDGAYAALAESIAEILVDAEVTIDDLRPLSSAVRRAVVSRSRYPVTRVNLLAALPDGSGLALDQIRAVDETIYAHALAHADDYLEALAGDEVTVSDPTAFIAVVEDVLAGAPTYLPQLVARAAPTSIVTDLDDVADGAWTALAAADRFPATLHNVARYIDVKGGIDTALAGRLTRADSIETSHSDEQSARQELALKILAARDVLADQELRVRLVLSLSLEESLPLESITPEPGDLIPLLLRGNLIDDDEDTFILTQGLDWASRERAIAASSRFAAFLSRSGLTSAEVPLVLASEEIHPDVREDLVLSSSAFVADGDRAALDAVAQYAAAHEVPATLPELARMASAGVDARTVVSLLERHLGSSRVDDLAPVLRALGGEYSKLTTRSYHRPHIADTPASRRLIDRLIALDLAKSMSEGDGVVIANMRHP